jgi:hypothetical protein
MFAHSHMDDTKSESMIFNSGLTSSLRQSGEIRCPSWSAIPIHSVSLAVFAL